MCPEPALLSAYVDGEAPSPWKERLAAHLHVCPACAAKAAAFGSLSAGLSASTGGAETEALARIESRLSARLGPALAAVPGPSAAPGARRFLGNRGVFLPLPLAAAAALALVFFAGLAASAFLKPGAAATVQNLATTEIAPSSANPASMDALVRYLEAQNAQVNLTIQLPSGATFDAAGKPVVVRADSASLPAAQGGDTGAIMVPLSPKVQP